MISLTIASGEAGRKIGRYLEKLFPKAPRSFFYKALRQNKIKVNRKKPADLLYELKAGDQVDLYFSLEQEAEFGFHKTESAKASHSGMSKRPPVKLSVVYEDEKILIAEKPVGILSQKARPQDVSITEIAREYLLQKGEAFDATFTPSFVHRLDRNTGGLMVMAKTLPVSQALSEMIRVHDMKKCYWALVKGDSSRWTTPTHLKDLYHKDEKINKASIRPFTGEVPANWQLCELIVAHQKCYGEYSLVEIELLTGKSHQIRAQLSSHGFPLLGDGKYNEGEKNFRQQLFAKAVEFHNCPEVIKEMEGRRIEAAVPSFMKTYL